MNSTLRPRRSGRRPGASGTREAIRAAAAAQFATRGYDRTTLRSIAAEAGVDAALVSHYFGSKQALFVDVARLPFDPAEALPRLLHGPADEVGERVARFALTLLEDGDARQRVTGLVRAAASEPAAAHLLRDLLAREVFARVAHELGLPDAPLRANLVGSQIVGLVVARYVVAVEPLASASAEEVVRAIAPTLQRYLTGPLAEPSA